MARRVRATCYTSGWKRREAERNGEKLESVRERGERLRALSPEERRDLNRRMDWR